MENSLITQSKKIKSQADKILKESGIVNILKEYGKVKFAGSYVLNTMVRPDLDLLIIRKKYDTQKAKEVFLKIFNLNYFHELAWVNGVDFKLVPPFPDIYFQARINVDAVEWKLDINLKIPSTDKSKELTDKFKLLLEQNPDKRLPILEIKQALREGEKYIPGVTGRLIYEAVLENSVTNVQDFKDFFSKQNGKTSVGEL